MKTATIRKSQTNVSAHCLRAFAKTLIFLGFFSLSFTGHWSLVTGHSVVYAQVPQLITYQGRLSEATGTPLTGTHTIVFRLYDAEQGGNKLWEETHTITVAREDNGIFSVVLGSLTSLSELNFNQPLWLTMAVDGDSEMTPRQRVTSAGYAINADTLDAMDSQQFVRSDAASTVTGELTLSRSGRALLVKPSADPTANTKVLEVQNAAGTSTFNVDVEGDAAVAGNLTVTGTITGASLTGGTVTSVDSGAGLTGGPVTTSGTLAVGAGTGIQVNADDIAVKLTSGSGLLADSSGLSLLRSCADNQLLKWNATTSVWACQDDADTNAGGDITGVIAGTGLSGGGSSGDVTVSLSTPVSVANGGTGLSSVAAGDLLYASAANTLSALTKGTDGQVLKLVSGLPAWGADSGGDGTVTSITAGTGLSGGTITTSGTISLSTPVSVANGGTGAMSLAAGQLLTGQGASAVTTTAVGAGLQIAGGQLSVKCMPIGGAAVDSKDKTFELAMFGGISTDGTADELSPIPAAGTLTSLSAYVNDSPGSGDSWTVTVRKNDANTSLSCTISGSSKSCSATGSVSVSAGDRLGARFVEGGSADQTDGSGWSACFIPD